MNSNRDSKGMFKAQMNDGERMTAAEQAERRAELARLSAMVKQTAESAGNRMMQQQAVKAVAVETVDVMAAHELRLAKMRERAGVK